MELGRLDTDVHNEQLIKRLKELANVAISMGQPPRLKEPFLDMETCEAEKCDEDKIVYKPHPKRSLSAELLCHCAMCVTDNRGHRPSVIRLLDNDPCYKEFIQKTFLASEEIDELSEQNSDSETTDYVDTKPYQHSAVEILDCAESGDWDQDNKFLSSGSAGTTTPHCTDKSQRQLEVIHNKSDPVDCSLQISKLLVVDPNERYTATQALAHPFFKRDEREKKRRQFFPRRLFKASVITIIALHRIKNLHLNPPPIAIETVKTDPYSIKTFRKIIDAGAFRIYGHWVKKGENQNRAALFENVPKKDLKSAESAPMCVLDVEVKGRLGRQPLKIVIDSI